MATWKSKRTIKIIATAAVCTVLGAGVASAQQQQRPAELHFADLGSIWSWQPDGINAMYIENVRHEWYYATFFTPCHSLPFAFAVAFVTEPNGDLNKYSSILVDGERCWFKTFSKGAKPDNDDGRHLITSGTK